MVDFGGISNLFEEDNEGEGELRSSAALMPMKS